MAAISFANTKKTKKTKLLNYFKPNATEANFNLKPLDNKMSN